MRGGNRPRLTRVTGIFAGGRGSVGAATSRLMLFLLTLVSMTAAYAHELPPEPGASLVLGSAEVEAIENGQVIALTRQAKPVARIVPLDQDQDWYWTPEWQRMEGEADEEIAAGRLRHFSSGEEFLDYLGRQVDEMNRGDAKPGQDR
jgi:antitoxin (DNA-binding transcriptional repressor) of toxin-antitoxin stability system